MSCAEDSHPHLLITSIVDIRLLLLLPQSYPALSLCFDFARHSPLALITLPFYSPLPLFHTSTITFLHVFHIPASFFPVPCSPHLHLVLPPRALTHPPHLHILNLYTSSPSTPHLLSILYILRLLTPTPCPPTPRHCEKSHRVRGASVAETRRQSAVQKRADGLRSE